ncbi:MAG: tRNA (adenosine(37)-N6)-threonylcarbamoyltransferase complex transferase subunit TsaD [Candidatus Marinimicrobia bacterium]|nr:tRNA (adenosine(37)-N6)-threonylcarbamoyltransferase complex transferase subunit TsaD [Candidatus Neomarinimicrobiota bacterium]|tara:strand:+ start:4064 stop:5050 length:987 start_codon:yes stop_codon:yes gene_type:complete
MIVLGIETSCDETAASVCSNRKILSNIVSSQYIHSNYGGVIPELASREHEKYLNLIVNSAINKSGIKLSNLEAIAVTQGPGLAGTLLTGISFAKGLSLSLDIPIVAINHLEAHIFANFLTESNLKFPFVCLLVSGGHTQLWHVKNINDYYLLGETLDDAAGEAFDKGARILNLGYPGGPEIEKAGMNGNPKAINFPRSLLGKNSLDFSFSGLKTSLLYFMDKNNKNKIYSIEDIASSYQEAIIDNLFIKLKRAVDFTKTERCVIAGGVAANTRLRTKIKNNLNIDLYFPSLKYCTDNAAMISFLGEMKLSQEINSDLNFSAEPNLALI